MNHVVALPPERLGGSLALPAITGLKPVPHRRGGMAVEMALLLPLLLILTFGIIEFGRMMQVSHQLTVASRTAARRASLPGATTEEAVAAATAQLAPYLPPAFVVEVTPPDLSQVTAGQPVSVRVHVPWEAVELIGFFPFTGGMTLESASEFRRETGLASP